MRPVSLSKDTLFLKRTNRLSREGHSYFLAINHKGLLLKIWLEDTLSTAQAKTYVISVHFPFTGEFTSCCHIIFPLQPFYITVFLLFGQGVDNGILGYTRAI